MALSTFRKLPTYEIIRTPEEAERLIAHLNPCKLIAFDTETSGLNRQRDFAHIISLSDGIGRWAVWPDVLRCFKDFLEDPERRLIAHNANFDQWMLLNVGIDLDRHMARSYARVIDTMVMHALLDDTAPHDLKFLSRALLGIEMVPFNAIYPASVRSKRSNLDIFLDPAYEEITGHYAALDAYATYHLFLELYKKLLASQITRVGSPYANLWEYYRDTEMLYTRVLWNMERNGLRLNQETLLARAPDLEMEALQIQSWFCKQLRSFNVNLRSNPQMVELFFTRFQREPLTFTNSGAPQLSGATLKLWAKRDKCEYAAKLLRYRDITKQLSTYVTGLLERVGPTGKIHTTLVQTGAKTGRLASREPNLQNQPPYIRDAYEADEGYVLRASDFAQLEMRILAHMSQDAALCAAIREGRDVHSATAAVMYKIPYEEIAEAKRKDDASEPLSATEKGHLTKRKGAKTINFGIMYGMGAGKLARELGLDLQEARGIIQRYFEALPGIPNYFDEAIAAARRDGYCQTLLGRRKQVPEIWSSYSGLVARAERQVKNAPIQGTASEITKMAQLAIWKDPYITASGTKMLLQIHDEILLHIPVAYEHDARLRETVDRHMATGIGLTLAVPLDTSGKTGRTWGACK